MDIASNDLNAVMLPIPSEMRIFVFLASGRDPEMETKWLECGGITTFLVDRPETCGICLFRRGAGDMDLIAPFFSRAGKEANVFYFCGRKKKFVRVDREWLDTYSILLST